MKLNLNKEIWQTTNLQPWIEALASNLISIKTRTSFPVVPIGAIVFLHASKSKVWPYWSGLSWAAKLDPKNWDRGKIVAIAEVENVGLSNKIFKNTEKKFWEVEDDCAYIWSSIAEWAIRFKNIHRLKIPVETRGFQAPFVRAKQETIEKVLKLNSYLK